MYNVNVALEERDEETSTVKICLYGLAPIQAGNKVKYQRVRLNAGVIPTLSWDATISRPSQAYSRQDGGSLHRSIDFMCLTLQRAYMESPHKTALAVRTKYNELMGKGKVVQRRSTMLLDIVRAWEQREDRSAHTMHTYTVFRRKVEEYEQHRRLRIDLNKATTEELEALLKWIQSTYRLAGNTMATQNKFLGMALNELRNAGISVPKNVRLFTFKTPKKEILEWDELARVINYEPKNRTEANAQTILVGLCLSGVRISDTWQFFGSIAKRGGVLCADFIQTKNSGRHPVCVSPIVYEPVRALIARHGSPYHISEKHIRVSTKNLLRTVGITRPVQVHSYRRGFVSLMLGASVADWALAKTSTGHVASASGRGLGMLHSYNHGSMNIAHKTIIATLRRLDPRQTAGIALLSDEVCSF